MRSLKVSCLFFCESWLLERTWYFLLRTQSFHKSNQTLGYSSPRFLCDVTRDYPIKYVELHFNSTFLKMNSVQNFKSQMRLKYLILIYIFLSIAFYKGVYLQLIAQYLVCSYRFRLQNAAIHRELQRLTTYAACYVTWQSQMVNYTCKVIP